MDQLDDLLKHLTGATATPAPTVLYKKTLTAPDGKVIALIEENIAGLLTQSELTAPQIDLLRLLLNTWLNYPGPGGRHDCL